jgi:hypothetical protein
VRLPPADPDSSRSTSGGMAPEAALAAALSVRRARCISVLQPFRDSRRPRPLQMHQQRNNTGIDDGDHDLRTQHAWRVHTVLRTQVPVSYPLQQLQMQMLQLLLHAPVPHQQSCCSPCMIVVVEELAPSSCTNDGMAPAMTTAYVSRASVRWASI